MRILLVDDDVGVRQTLDMVFSMMGVETVHAACGAEALALVALHSFDFIVMDVNMPGMSGIDVLRRLQANPETSSIPVVILSGESEAIFRRQAMEAGATYFVNKPFDLEEFRQVIDSACPIAPLTATEASLSSRQGAFSNPIVCGEKR